LASNKTVTSNIRHSTFIPRLGLGVNVWTNKNIKWLFICIQSCELFFFKTKNHKINFITFECTVRVLKQNYCSAGAEYKFALTKPTSCVPTYLHLYTSRNGGGFQFRLLNWTTVRCGVGVRGEGVRVCPSKTYIVLVSVDAFSLY